MTLHERRRYKVLHTSITSKAPRLIYRFVAPVLFIASATAYYIYYRILK